MSEAPRSRSAGASTLLKRKEYGCSSSVNLWSHDSHRDRNPHLCCAALDCTDALIGCPGTHEGRDDQVSIIREDVIGREWDVNNVAGFQDHVGRLAQDDGLEIDGDQLRLA